MKETPPLIEKFRLIAVVNGVPQQEFDILRGPEERKFTQTEKLDLFGDTASATILAATHAKSRFGRSQSHKLSALFLGSSIRSCVRNCSIPTIPSPLSWPRSRAAAIELRPGLSFNGEAETSLFDNFNLDRQSNSALPHVRSDFVKYFAQGKTGIGELDTEYRFRLAPNDIRDRQGRLSGKHVRGRWR